MNYFSSTVSVVKAWYESFIVVQTYYSHTPALGDTFNNYDEHGHCRLFYPVPHTLFFAVAV